MVDSNQTRRTFLSLTGGAAVMVIVRPVAATPAMQSAAIRNIVGEANVRTGDRKSVV